MLVRSGRTATLMFEGEYIHMTLPVLCLQNGGRGQQVRVISKDTKRRIPSVGNWAWGSDFQLSD